MRFFRLAKYFSDNSLHNRNKPDSVRTPWVCYLLLRNFVPCVQNPRHHGVPRSRLHISCYSEFMHSIGNRFIIGFGLRPVCTSYNPLEQELFQPSYLLTTSLLPHVECHVEFKCVPCKKSFVEREGANHLFAPLQCEFLINPPIRWWWNNIFSCF